MQVREPWRWWNLTYDEILFSEDGEELGNSGALNHVGGDIWMEELSQKNRNVLCLVCLAGWWGKGMPSIQSGIRWISTQRAQSRFFIPDTGKPQVLLSPDWPLHLYSAAGLTCTPSLQVSPFTKNREYLRLAPPNNQSQRELLNKHTMNLRVPWTDK